MARDDAQGGEAMIATSHPLSTAAGLAILQEGGNAVDAAIAAVAVQCVAKLTRTNKYIGLIFVIRNDERRTIGCKIDLAFNKSF